MPALAPTGATSRPKAVSTSHRSEGLGVASLRAFSGLFSSPGTPLRVDAAGLRAVTTDALARAFSVARTTPLVGLEGRVTLLRRLGDARQPTCGVPWCRTPRCAV